MPTSITFTDPEKLIDRTETTTVRLTVGDDGWDDGWDDGAIVPTDQWQPLGTADAELSRANDDAAPSTVIELVSGLLDHVIAHSTIAETPDVLDPLSGRHPATFVGFTDSDPGKRTTTTDWSTDRRIGVHLDNFDRLPVADRTLARRRLGINLGPGTRWLLVATTDVLDICQTLGTDDPGHYPHTDDLRRYVADGHPLRLLRLLRIRLDPGDAYIAPTELLPHDGSTLGASDPSRIAFWLGDWPVGILPSLI
ncbi:hypothetical protein L1785_03120 [Antribacter sp. KLBMP9083]|uniref:Uncharacterized protein n=1 Tax=Antribacter soli TaxID=2910976 RepID=A0AA41QC88_9MICO|nr:hypothetical protein [Antribacter soli]MCF4119961.1 hypothetical protein [Antribacter soli]